MFSMSEDASASDPVFQPAWWLRGAHMQTLWGRLTRSRRVVSFRREVLPTPDGDELILDHLDGPPSGTHFILVHGLEGSSYSVYMQGLLTRVASHGHTATVMNFRYCARDPQNVLVPIPNRRPRLYHSGETSDLDLVIRTMAGRLPGVRLVGVGISLGGNVLLKWLGEQGGESLITAAATISSPFDLAAGARFLETRIGRLYTETFLRSLRRKALDVASRFEEAAALIDVDATRKSRTIWQFDDAATAPLHGFTGAADYYARSSSKEYVGKIEVPTLCISAEDDPLVPGFTIPPARAAASRNVRFVATKMGGHVGFVSSVGSLRCRYWAEETAVDWVV